MNNFIRAILVFCLVTILNIANAKIVNIVSYAQLVNSLEQGHHVRGIVFFKHCRPLINSDSKFLTMHLANATTGFNFNSYLHDSIIVNGQEKNAVITSMMALNEQETGVLRYNYARLRLFVNNSAQLYIASYDPLTYVKKIDMTLNCSINNGTNNSAIKLFDTSM